MRTSAECNNHLQMFQASKLSLGLLQVALTDGNRSLNVGSRWDLYIFFPSGLKKNNKKTKTQNATRQPQCAWCLYLLQTLCLTDSTSHKGATKHGCFTHFMFGLRGELSVSQGGDEAATSCQEPVGPQSPRVAASGSCFWCVRRCVCVRVCVTHELSAPKHSWFRTLVGWSAAGWIVDVQ